MLFINKKTARESSFITEGRKKLAITGEVAAASNSSRIFWLKLRKKISELRI